MGVSYLSDMSRWANEYRALMVQASMIRERNDNIPSRKEAECYKRAAELTEKLANLSVGEEYQYWIRCQQEVSRKFNEISEYALRMTRGVSENETAPGKTNAEGRKASSDDKKGQKTRKKGDYEVPQEVVDRWIKSDPNDPETPKHGFESVAGMEELVEKLKNCVRDVSATQINKYLGMDTVNSFFLYGPPGCGKTFISKAFAYELMKQGYKYMTLSGGDIHNSLVGESEKYVERAFREAENLAPCIFFIDEIDSVCRNRSLPNIPSHAMSTTTAFLTGYNGICNSDKPIIFIGATNYPNLVDDAMLDRVELIKLPLPDMKVREHTFKLIFNNIIQNEPGFTYEDMADETDNYNQRDIKRLCKNIKRLIKKDLQSAYPQEEQGVKAMQSGEYRLKRELFMEALKSYVPSKKEDILKSLDAWDLDREKRADE